MHSNIYEFFALLFLLGFITGKGYTRRAMTLAYPLAFLIGVITDVDSLAILKGTVVFGAGGFFDGDFLGSFLFFALFYIVFFADKIFYKIYKRKRVLLF